MSDEFSPPPPYDSLLDAYCDGSIDEEQLRTLESYLLESRDARLAFVKRFQLETEVHFAIRSRRAAGIAIERVLATSRADSTRTPLSEPVQAETLPPTTRPRLKRWLALGAVAAGVGLLVLLLNDRHGRDSSSTSVKPALERRDGNVAWLVNAQDCHWAEAEAEMPGRDMRAGKVLGLRHGLAEIEFECGAHVILQGPAELVLVNGTTARLVHGSLTARVPEPARGFTIFSPRGKVVDLGTEFGLSVDEQGATTVQVFRGMVAAFPLSSGIKGRPAITLSQNEAARINSLTVDLVQGGSTALPLRFIRNIEPPPLITPRRRWLDFKQALPESIKDFQGRGIGLTHRLPGTGAALPANDPNLLLNPEDGSLRLTTTRGDLNTQDRMRTGEYLGLRLSDLGFTGVEDFEIETTISKIPGLREVGQFGLYAGVSSVKCIRGGLISWPEPDHYGLFLVKNLDGADFDLNEIGLMNSGDDLRLTLRRLGGKFSLLVENLTRGSSSTLAVTHPAFLDHEPELFVGLFGANPQSDTSKTLTIRGIRCTVWTSQANGSGPPR